MEVELYAGRRTNRQTDRQKDMTWSIVAFRNFVNEPTGFPYNTLQIKNSSWYRHINCVPQYMS
jgi:hypothetical protein